MKLKTRENNRLDDQILELTVTVAERELIQQSTGKNTDMNKNNPEVHDQKYIYKIFSQSFAPKSPEDADMI